MEIVLGLEGLREPNMQGPLEETPENGGSLPLWR